MCARLLPLQLMLELAVRRSGSWKGKKDVRTEDNKDKLEPSRTTWQLLLPLPLVVWVSHRSFVMMLNLHLAWGKA